MAAQKRQNDLTLVQNKKKGKICPKVWPPLKQNIRNEQFRTDELWIDKYKDKNLSVPHLFPFKETYLLPAYLMVFSS